jgi:plastocyanin
VKKLLVLLVALALASLSVTACGGDDDDDGGEEAATTEQTTETAAGGGGGGDGGGGATTLQLSADPGGELAYDTSSLDASAGEVTIEFDNPASLSHDVCIESPDGEEVGCSDLISEDSTELTEELQPGDYTFYCSVAGHREAGMEGTLTVQ